MVVGPFCPKSRLNGFFLTPFIQLLSGLGHFSDRARSYGRKRGLQGQRLLLLGRTQALALHQGIELRFHRPLTQGFQHAQKLGLQGIAFDIQRFGGEP